MTEQEGRDARQARSLKETGESRVERYTKFVEFEDEATGERIWFEAGPTPEGFERLLVRTLRNARELASLFERGGFLSTTTTETAFNYLADTERRIADLRVTFQQRFEETT